MATILLNAAEKLHCLMEGLLFINKLLIVFSYCLKKISIKPCHLCACVYIHTTQTKKKSLFGFKTPNA